MDVFFFFLKKVLSRLFFPVGLVLSLGFLGLILWSRLPGRRVGKALVVIALTLLLTLSLPVTSWLLLRPLELEAGPYADPARLSAYGVRYIVVLGGSARLGERRGADRINGAGMFRLIEGIRLWRAVPGSRLVLSGGRFLPGPTGAGAMAQVAYELGVPPDAVILEGKSWDTEDQAKAMARILRNEPFALVTSAGHMARALYLFRRQGLEPLPAPTDFRTGALVLDYGSFIPQTGALDATQAAMYEYLGRAWAWVKGLWAPAAEGRVAP